MLKDTPMGRESQALFKHKEVMKRSKHYPHLLSGVLLAGWLTELAFDKLYVSTSLLLQADDMTSPASDTPASLETKSNGNDTFPVRGLPAFIG